MRRPCSPILALLILVFQVTTVSAAAPHIMLIQGSLLDRPVLMADWQENHAVMSSLGEEGSAKHEDLTTRDYLDIALFWGPKWLEYKTKGGSIGALTQEKANQKARFYLARGDSPPVLVFEGKAPRYVGSEGVRVLVEHGVPVSSASQEIQASTENSKWFIAAVMSILLFAGMSLIAIRMVLHPGPQEEPQPAIMTNVAEPR